MGHFWVTIDNIKEPPASRLTAQNVIQKCDYSIFRHKDTKFFQILSCPAQEISLAPCVRQVAND